MTITTSIPFAANGIIPFFTMDKQCFMVCLVTQSCPTLCDPMQGLTGSSVHGVPQARNWSGLPFPSPGELPRSGIETVAPALAGRLFTTEHWGSPHLLLSLTSFPLLQSVVFFLIPSR